MNFKIVSTDINSLKPNPKNNNKHSSTQIKRLAKIIEHQGFRNPIIVSKNSGFIVSGHARLLASKELNLKKVPVIFQEFKSYEQEYAFMTADNEIARWAILDIKKLKFETQNWDIDPKLFGLNIFEIKKDSEKEESLPEQTLENELNISIGDVFTLGEHRLMCGDATNPDHVKKLMNKKQADLCVTDPPYNVDYGNNPDKFETIKRKKIKYRPIKNDKLKDLDFKSFLKKSFENCNSIMKEGASIYSFYAQSESVNFVTAFTEANFKLAQIIIWKKNSIVIGKYDYQMKHEPVLYGWKKGAAHKWCSNRKQTTILEFNKPQKSRLHPTMKPVDLLSYLILNSSENENDIVVDFFLGSGSTLIACEKNNRTCYGMELNPSYCEVIIKRWEKYTGRKANV